MRDFFYPSICELFDLPKWDFFMDIFCINSILKKFATKFFDSEKITIALSLFNIIKNVSIATSCCITNSNCLTIKTFKKIKGKSEAKIRKITFIIFHAKVDICLPFNAMVSKMVRHTLKVFQNLL